MRRRYDGKTHPVVVGRHADDGGTARGGIARGESQARRRRHGRDGPRKRRYSIVRAERPFMICSVVLISGARFTVLGATVGASAEGIEYAVGGSIR